MSIFSSLSKDHLNKLNSDGVIIIPNLIPESTIDEIKKDTSSWFKKISFNNRISSYVINSNQWIEHGGLCSLESLKVALDISLIDFLKEYFMNDPSLGAISVQKKIFSENGIPLHSDLGDGLSVFIYLTKPDEKFGITEFVKKTHLCKIDKSFQTQNKIDDATYIDLEKSPFSEKDIIKTHGGVGTVVIFHRSIWHKLPKFNNAGREILMLRYFKKNTPSNDHLVKNSFLKQLTPIQKQVLLENSAEKIAPSISELGSNNESFDIYKIPDWKMYLYFLKFKLFSKAKTS